MRLIFFVLIFSLSGITGRAETSRIKLTPAELACLEKIIYFNECSGRSEKLISWRRDENFPSLGIGHFIWYPRDLKGPYEETFPAFLRFAKEKSVGIPPWINELPGFECPWKDREEFQRDLQGAKLISLRDFLEETRDLQTAFIVRRFEESLPRILEVVPPKQRPLAEKKLSLVDATPNGIFALIDYVNFKGEGILESERFAGQGWGLLQILEEMKVPNDPADALAEFIQAAQAVLERRVKNASITEEEVKRLQGWKNRVLRYASLSC